MKSLLILAALPEEADAFRPGEGCIVEGEPMPVRIVETGAIRITIVTCGLGKVNAALAVGRYANADTSKSRVWQVLQSLRKCIEVRRNQSDN